MTRPQKTTLGLVLTVLTVGVATFAICEIIVAIVSS